MTELAPCLVNQILNTDVTIDRVAPVQPEESDGGI